MHRSVLAVVPRESADAWIPRRGVYCVSFTLLGPLWRHSSTTIGFGHSWGCWCKHESIIPVIHWILILFQWSVGTGWPWDSPDLLSETFLQAEVLIIFLGDDLCSIPMTRSSIQGASTEQPCYLDVGKMRFENSFCMGVQGLLQIVGSRSWILKKTQEKSFPGSTFISCLVLGTLSSLCSAQDKSSLLKSQSLLWQLPCVSSIYQFPDFIMST